MSLFAEPAPSQLELSFAPAPLEATATSRNELQERARTLAVVAPLTKLLTSMGEPACFLDKHTLAMSAIGYLIDSLRLMNLSESSLTAQALRNKVAADMGKQFSALLAGGTIAEMPGRQRITELAELVVDQLLARGSRGVFSKSLYVPDQGFEEFEFQLIEPYDDPNGDLLIRPTAACTNLYLNALGQPLSDLQAALAAIIDRQIARGDFAMAEKSALQHRSLTHRHLLEINLLSKAIDKNVREVSWQEDLQPRLESAEIDIPPLIRNDEQLYDTLVGNIDALTGPQGPLAKKVLAIIKECRDIYRDIWVVTKKMRVRFSNTLLKQTLFSRQSSLPILEHDVLGPLMRLPDSTARKGAEQGLVAIFGGVRQVTVQDLPFVMERLLMPKQGSGEILDLAVPPNLVSLQGMALSRYPDGAVQEARELLESLPQEGELLSSLAAKAAAGTAPGETAQFLGLAAILGWADQENAGLLVEKTGEAMACSGISGDDFLLKPLPVDFPL